MPTPQTAVLVDERDNQLGLVQVNSSCQIIAHNEALFVRTPRNVRVNGRVFAPAIVFQEYEAWERPKLEPIR